MEGVRNASTRENGFQIRPGAPELNCCSANAPRGVGEVVRWMLRAEEDALYLNFLGAAELHLEDGAVIRVEGDYPYHHEIRMHLQPGSRYRRLYLRIPGWSESVEIEDGVAVARFRGDYAPVEMAEKTVTARLRMTVRYLPGEGDYAGKYSVYRGPLLFGLREPAGGIQPRIPAAHIAQAEPRRTEEGLSLVLPGGIRLRDFCHLGQDGRMYRTWLDIFGI
jgi:DUF1680 family protein